MPVYKDLKTNTWYVKFYFTDYEGNKKQKLKRGFLLQREAKEWERNFLENKQFIPSMLLRDFIELYKKDTYKQKRLHTIINKDYKHKNISEKLMNSPINEITVLNIRTWQNELIERGFKTSNIQSIQKELSAIFNHAIRFYNLPKNPCRLAGTVKIPDEEPSKMRFWTLEEFRQVINHIEDIKAYTAILLLYWSGMRKGELYALTWAKLNEKTGAITINRSYQRLQGQDVFTQTKTYEARTILLPSFVLDKLLEYKASLYNSSDDDLIFPWSKEFIQQGIKKGVNGANEEIEAYNNTHDDKRPYIEPIHVHGLRHSHASYLISKGANIVLIADRLGHKDKSITLNTYSHFYPTDEHNLITIMNKDFIK